jgi:hypothetical protein
MESWRAQRGCNPNCLLGGNGLVETPSHFLMHFWNKQFVCSVFWQMHLSGTMILRFATILGFNCYLVKMLMSYFLFVLLIGLALLFLGNTQLIYFVTF